MTKKPNYNQNNQKANESKIKIKIELCPDMRQQTVQLYIRLKIEVRSPTDRPSFRIKTPNFFDENN